MIEPSFDHWIWLVPAFLIGACIGSFLNVVIYRVPLGMSVNEPNRSFCPKCRKPIPMSHNLPLVSWLWLKGKCAQCRAPIAFRYFGVELLTAVVFTLIWWVFAGCLGAPQAVIFLWTMAAILIALTFIDIEHLIIPTGMTWAGSAAGLVACAVWPQLPVLGGTAGNWWSGLISGGVGWATGFFGLWVVVILGKLALGRKAMRFEHPVDWQLKEAENDMDPMLFVIDGESIPWWDIFYRKSDRLVLEADGIRVDGQTVDGGTLVIREGGIELPDGTKRQIADLKSLDGTATSVVIPREAMGMGDVHLLGMAGAFFGWSGCFLTLFFASVFAIVAAAVGRIGFGKPLPFGPFLALGMLAWALGGWRFWAWYVEFLGPLWQQ